MSTRLIAFLEKHSFTMLSAGLGVIFIAKYINLAIQRVSFPFALEWVEGNAYLHVLRLLQGKAIYVPPAYEFIPMIYPPLYYSAAAPLAGWSGDIFLSMRVVSILASLLAFGALYGLCCARGLAREASFLAVGLFAAAYGLTGFWFDLGRVDSLFAALLLGAAWMAVPSRQALFLVPTQSVVTRMRPDLRAFAAAGLLLAALATKQQALVIFPFLLLDYLLHRQYRNALVFGVSFLVLAGSWVGLQQVLSQGWFWFYTVRLPAAAPYIEAMWGEFWTVHLLPHYFPLLLWGAAGLGVLLCQEDRRQAASLGLLVLPLVGMSYLSLVKQWGYVNGLVPAAAGLALAGAETLQAVWRLGVRSSMDRYHRSGHHPRMIRPRRLKPQLQIRNVGLRRLPLNRRRAVSRGSSCELIRRIEPTRGAVLLQNPCLLVLLLGALVCGQFWLLNYTAEGQIPLESSTEAGSRLVSRLRGAPGPIFVPAAPYLLDLAGKEVHFHASALGDLQLAGERDAQVQAVVINLQPKLAVTLSRVQTAVLPNARWFDDLFSPQKGYACQELAGSGEDLGTVSGAISISRLACLKK